MTSYLLPGGSHDTILKVGKCQPAEHPVPVSYSWRRPHSSHSSIRKAPNANLGWDDQPSQVSLPSFSLEEENSSAARERSSPIMQPWGYTSQTSNYKDPIWPRAQQPHSLRSYCTSPRATAAELQSQASPGWLCLRTAWCLGCLCLPKQTSTYHGTSSPFTWNKTGIMVGWFSQPFAAPFLFPFMQAFPLIISLHF